MDGDEEQPNDYEHPRSFTRSASENQMGYEAHQIDALAHNYVRAGAFSVVMEHDQAAGKKHAKIRFLADIPDNLFDETYAAVQYFRSSLDSLAWAVSQRPGISAPENVYFPIGKSQQSFKSIGMQGHTQHLGADWVAFVEKLKPYPEGNDLLCTLNAFNNADKHRLLTRIGQVSDVSSFTARFNKQMSWNVAMFGFGLDDGDVLVTVDESDPDPEVKLSIRLAFCEVGPDKVRGKQVVPTLKQFSELCTNIVDSAAPLFR